ncbi:MAG: hypothetical protein ABJB01_01740 [Rudaea sp.]
MKSQLTRATLIVALSICTPLVAKDKPPIPDLEKQNIETFQAQAAQVRKDMQKGGRFEYIKSDDRVRVDEGLTFMGELIQQNGTVAAMKEEDKVRLFNRQERINAILTNSDSQRMICEKADQPGTLMRATTCHTYAELQRRTRDAQNAIERTQNQNLQHLPSAGGN